MGFSTFDNIINAISTTGTMQRVNLYKEIGLTTNTSGFGYAQSSFIQSGNPGGGTDGTIGVTNGRVLTKSNAGAQAYNNAASGNNYLISASIATLVNSNTDTAAPTGVFILIDRIADCKIAYNQATASFTGLTAVSRLNTAGSAYAAGCQLYLEAINEPTSASSFTFTYINSEGTGSRVTQTITTVSNSGSLQGSSRNPPFSNRSSFYPFVGLSGTDRGVRSIQSITAVSGSDTGTMNVCLVRPIVIIPVFCPAMAVNKDFIVEIPCLERVWDNSYLSWIYMGAGLAAASGKQCNFIAQLRLVSL